MVGVDSRDAALYMNNKCGVFHNHWESPNNVYAWVGSPCFLN